MLLPRPTRLLGVIWIAAKTSLKYYVALQYRVLKFYRLRRYTVKVEDNYVSKLL